MDSNLLKKVLFITDSDFEPATSFMEKLEKEGLEIGIIPKDETKTFIKCEQGVLLITDSDEIFLRYRQSLPVYVYCHAGVNMSDFPGAVYLIEGLEDIRYHFLEGIYRRLKEIPWIIGEADRIQVREMTPEDAEALHMLYQSEEEWFMENLEDFGQSVEETREYLKSYRKNRYGICGYGMWVITDSFTENVIGRVGFQETGQEDVLELGFLVKKEWRRKGIAFKACQIALDYIFKDFPVFKIICVIHKDNRSARLLYDKLIKAGYEIERKEES